MAKRIRKTAKSVQRTVQLTDYHIAGIRAVEAKRVQMGKKTTGIMAELVRQGLELVFKEENISDDTILEYLDTQA